MVKYKVGQLVFFNWDNTLGKIIKEYDDSEWSHVGIISKIEGEKVTIHESRLLNGFRGKTHKKKNLDKLKEKGKLKNVSLKIDKYNEEELYKICKKYEKLPYGIGNYIFFPILYIFEKLGISRKILDYMFRETKRNSWITFKLRGAICSESVLKILYEWSRKTVNFELITKKAFAFTTPGDIYKHRNHDWRK